MGTSASAKGGGKDQPMVPPWADDQPGAALPKGPEKRFQSFRTAFGKHLRTGEERYLRRALGHYARTTTGGNSVAARRFGNFYAASGELYSVLSSLAGTGSDAAERGLAKESLTGQALDVVCQRLADALAPTNADADPIREAINEAMAEVLDENELFDPQRLDETTIHRIIAEFLSQAIFQDITREAGNSWNNASDPARAARAEQDLLELIRVIVDDKLGSHFNGRSGLSASAVKQFTRRVVIEVWQDWEGYGD